MKKITQNWLSSLKFPTISKKKTESSFLDRSEAPVNSIEDDWESTYEAFTLLEQTSPYFQAFQEDVFHHLYQKTIENLSGLKFHTESGKLDQSRKYFFIQKWDEEGWLVEQVPSGWITVRAIKIVSTDTFMRNYSPIDFCSVFYKNQKNKEPLIRIKSSLVAEEMISLPLYCKLYLDHLFND